MVLADKPAAWNVIRYCAPNELDYVLVKRFEIDDHVQSELLPSFC